MKTIALFFVILMAGFGSCDKVKAQPSGNLVSPNLIGGNYSSPTGTVSYSGVGGGTSGGSTPGYNSTTNTIYFGYTTSTAAYTYAFSQALQNSGMTILGYNYSWDYYNQGYSAGALSAKVNFAGTDGTSLHFKSWTLGTTTDWTTMSGTETFTGSGLLASNIANFSLSFTGKDNRFWAGYYGPMVKNPSLSLNYTFDQCSVDPLSSPTCPGYAAAYLTQQCSANPLYDASCPGYAQALLTQQCNANQLSNPQCPGYATAYLNYQCSINPLFSTTCSGYQQAYFNQQCSLNGLYDKTCPNYAEAYAKKNILSVDTTSTTQTTTTTTTVSTTAPSTTVSSDGTVSTTVSKTGDSNVDKAITPTTTTTNSSAAPAAPVQLVQSPSSSQQQSEKKEAAPAQTTSQTTTQTNEKSSGSGEQKTARQELQEKREAAAKKDAVEKGKNLANEMSKAADMESQKQIQNVVIQAMAFTPGFDTYNQTTIPDTVGYKPYSVYNNQKNVDNARLSRGLFGATDRLHNEMVNQQYGN